MSQISGTATVKCITISISILEHCEPVCIEKYCQQKFGLLGALKFIFPILTFKQLSL